MISQASTILFTGGGCVVDTPGQTPPGQTPPAQCMLGYIHTPYPVHAGIHATPFPAATAADGTHPTGMHSCLSMIYDKFKHMFVCVQCV